jgi:hypothetical protein
VREADANIDYSAAFVELARVANRPCLPESAEAPDGPKR